VNGNFATAGSGVLSMTTPGDALTVNGNATFGGGNETGLLTTGTLTVTGNFTQSFSTGGQEFVATAGHITRFTGAPTISFAQPTVSSFARVEFTGPGATTSLLTNVTTTGDVWLQTGGPTNVIGAVVAKIGGSLYDTTGGRWQVANTSMTGINGHLPKALTTNLSFTNATLLFDTVGVTGNVSVTGASAQLDLNGHPLLIVNGFSTNAGGVLKMTHASDTLVVGGSALFAGGNTSGLLTNGTLTLMNGFTQLSGGSVSSFAPTVSFKTVMSGTIDSVFFTNPATSFFQDVDLAAGSTMYLRSAANINGTLTKTGGGSAATVLSATGGPFLLTTSGLNQTGTDPMNFTNALLKFLDGTSNATFDNVNFNGFSAAFAGSIFESARSGGPYTFGSGFPLNFGSAGFAASATAHFINNSGTATLNINGLPSFGGSGIEWVGTGPVCWGC
jgi:hypothetical protein